MFVFSGSELGIEEFIRFVKLDEEECSIVAMCEFEYLHDVCI